MSYNSVTGVYQDKVAQNIVEIVDFSDPSCGPNSSKTNPFEAVNCAHVFAEVFIFLLYHHKRRGNTKRKLISNDFATYK